MEYKFFIDGQWVDGGPALEVTNKYTGRSSELCQPPA